MTTINGKLWLSIAEVIKTYGNARVFWVKRATEGKIIAKQTGKKYMFSKASIEAYLTGEKVDGGDNQKEILALEKQTSLQLARTKLKIANRDDGLVDLDLDSIADLKKVRAEFEPKRQALAEQEARLSKKQTKQDETANEQYQGKEWIRKAWADLVGWRGLFESDLETMREAYQSFCSSCRQKLPDPQDMKLPAEVFEGDGDLTPKWKGTPSEEQSEQFEEKEGE